MKILLTGGTRFIGMHAALGTQVTLDLQPLAPEDVPSTCADISQFKTCTWRTPPINLKRGIERFVAWCRACHRV